MGLIARTWGNVSARLNDEQFVITPSGRPYEKLTAADIVTVNVADETHEGDVKPSSEKGVHAAVYRRRPDAHFVIHTHQLHASVVSTLRRDVTTIPEPLAAIVGPRVYCTDFALPTTKKLAANVAKTLARAHEDARAFLLAGHGALCFGADADEAFAVAVALEDVCQRFVAQKGADTGRPASGKDVRPLYNSRRIGDNMELCVVTTSAEPKPIRVPLLGDSARAVPPEARVHRAIYERWPHIEAIVHTTEPEVVAVSEKGRPVRPLLDDFAQIVGTNARVVPRGPLATVADDAARRLRGRYAVLLEGNGALCCAPSLDDALAVAHVVHKNCRALLTAELFGRPRPIPFVPSLLMRVIYTMSYSKRARDEA